MRIVGGAVAAVAAAAVAAVTALVVTTAPGSVEVATPSADREATGVLRGSDAVPAVEGEDYEVLRQIPGRIAHRAEVLLADDALVLQERNRSRGDRLLPDRVVVWDPATGDRERLPTPWRAGESPELTATSATDVWASFNAGRLPGSGNSSRQARRVLHYDRTTGTSEVHTAPRVARARGDFRHGLLRPGGDGRLYFMTGPVGECFPYECPGVRQRELWSFDPDAPGRVRKEADGSVEFAVSGELLAWVSYDGDQRVTLRVRPLAGGAVQETTIDDCGLSDVAVATVLAADDAVLSGCGVALDDHAQPLARIRLRDHHDLAGASDRRWLAFGRTVYDTDTGRFLRIAEDRHWEGRRVVLQDDRVLFPSGDEPRSTRRGSWTLARLTG